MKILLLSGPPGAGKDAVGAEVELMLDKRGLIVERLKFAAVLREAAAGALGLSALTVQALERDKDTPAPALLGRTWREVLIQLSEDFFKPLFGQRYFGEAMLTALCGAEAAGVTHAVITDSGFPEEAEPLLVPGWHVHHVRLSRPGHTYEGDSRRAWSGSEIGSALGHYTEGDVENTGTVGDAAMSALESWLGS